MISCCKASLWTVLEILSKPGNRLRQLDTSDDWCWCVIDHGSRSNISHRVISLSSFYRIVTKANVDVSVSKTKTAPPTTKPETYTHNYIHTITHTLSNYVRRQLLLISMHFLLFFFLFLRPDITAHRLTGRKTPTYLLSFSLAST